MVPYVIGLVLFVTMLVFTIASDTIQDALDVRATRST